MQSGSSYSDTFSNFLREWDPYFEKGKQEEEGVSKEQKDELISYYQVEVKAFSANRLLNRVHPLTEENFFEDLCSLGQKLYPAVTIEEAEHPVAFFKRLIDAVEKEAEAFRFANEWGSFVGDREVLYQKIRSQFFPEVEIKEGYQEELLSNLETEKKAQDLASAFGYRFDLRASRQERWEAIAKAVNLQLTVEDVESLEDYVDLVKGRLDAAEMQRQLLMRSEGGGVKDVLQTSSRAQVAARVATGQQVRKTQGEIQTKSIKGLDGKEIPIIECTGMLKDFSGSSKTAYSAVRQDTFENLVVVKSNEGEKAFKEEMRRNRLYWERGVAVPELVAVDHKTKTAYFEAFDYDGDTFRQTMKSGDVWAPGHVIELGKTLFSSAIKLLKLGEVHRDYKPGNLLVSRIENEDRFKFALIDFNLVAKAPKKGFRLRANPLRNWGLRQIAGTPAYMAPESFWHKGGTEKADVFSIGATLYEMLTGKVYREDVNDWSWIRKQIESIPGGRDLMQLIEDCVEAEASKRPTFQKAYDRLSGMQQPDNFNVPNINVAKPSMTWLVKRVY